MTVFQERKWYCKPIRRFCQQTKRFDGNVPIRSVKKKRGTFSSCNRTAFGTYKKGILL